MDFGASVTGPHNVLYTPRQPYAEPPVGELVPAADTSSWYKTQYGCIRWDQTKVQRQSSFPDGPIPRGLPLSPAPHSRVCLQYLTSAAPYAVDAEAMVEAAMAHPQFAFRAGGPGTAYQIDVESQLRRLDQPLSRVQAVIPSDAPLHRNTVAPPQPRGVPEGPQNAANPIAAILRPDADDCRMAADAAAASLSNRMFNNPTRQDTKRFDEPFEPPGIGTPSVHKPAGVSLGGQPMY